MLKLENVTDASMIWVKKDDKEGCFYKMIEDSLILSSDQKSLKFTMKSEKNREYIDDFDLIIVQKEDSFHIKSDFYNNPSALDKVSIYEGDESFILEYLDNNEITYLHLYCDGAIKDIFL